jgi:pilus assembly protein CpaB
MKFHFKNIRLSKTWIVLGISLAVGLLAALGARSYLSSQMAAIEARGKGETVKVVVAKGKLQKGDVVSSDTVAVRSVPTDYAHSNALRPNQFDAFDGKALAFSVDGGEMVLWSMLEGKKSPTFSARVDVGHRALTVPVDEINSISGLLEPGDLIDLMVTVSQKDKKFTFPLLQAVRVMATGQRSVDDPKSGERRQYSTVTLDASPEQAQNVIVAREAGKITALLRNPSDKQAFKGGNTDLAGLLGLKPELDLKPAETAIGIRQIPVLYGGRGATLPAEGLQMGKYVQASTGQLPTIAPPMAASIGHIESPMPVQQPLPVASTPVPSGTSSLSPVFKP